MTELPKRQKKTEMRPGDRGPEDRGPGLQCKNCGYGIPVGGSPSRLPESFEVTCPTCLETRGYRSKEVVILEPQLKH
jgi:hypothetical protein